MSSRPIRNGSTGISKVDCDRPGWCRTRQVTDVGTAKDSEVIYLIKKQYSLPGVIRGKPTIAFINEDLPHADDPVKAIEVRSEANIVYKPQ